MPIQRSGSCDQRRRRVLIEEKLHSGDCDAKSARGEPCEDGPETVRLPGRRYGEEASSDHQQPLTALVPKRPLTLVLLVLAGLLLIAAIQAPYGHVSQQPSDHWLRAVASLDVEAAGGLASWCSSVFLLAAAVQGLQIYRLRRHRSDDYRGRYRVWAWASPLLLAASLAVGTHLHLDLMAAAATRSDVLASIEPRIVSFILPAVLWLLFALRLTFEVRESRAAWTALAFAAVAHCAAAVVGLAAPAELFSLTAALTISTLTMLGHLTIFMTVASYSRYVYLDAHGLLAPRQQVAPKARPKRAPRRKKNEGDTADDKSAVLPVADAQAEQEPEKKQAKSGTVTGTPTIRREPAVAKQVEPPPPQTEAPETDEDEDDSAGLSKSERRRLKKLKRRDATLKAA
jgi:hypothetical protein